MRTLFLFLLVLALSVSVWGAPYSTQAVHSQAFAMKSAGINQQVIDFNLPAWKLETVVANGTSYQKMVIDESDMVNKEGFPELPSFHANVAIPYHGSAQVNVTYQSERRVPVNQYYPSQGGNEDNTSVRSFIKNESYYQQGGVYPEQLIQSSAPGVMREFRYVNFTLHPVSYDAQTRELVIRDHMTITVNFVADRGTNEMEAPTSYSEAFRPLYEANLINFNEMVDRSITWKSPTILLIHKVSTDATYNSKLADFVNWKRQKGFTVNVANSNATGSNTASIKNYILNAYNNPATRPDYVILFGDVGDVPTFTETYSSYGGEGDYPYTLLVGGDDNTGDVYIGRISFGNTSDLSVLVAKIFSYERNVDMSNTTWYNNMLLVGDSYHSGISTYYTNYYIKEISKLANPDYSYTELLSSEPTPSQINQGLNAPVGVFNYRGYLGMSNWSPSASNLTSSKVCHAVIITCGTGSFAGTSTTESFTRLGTAAAPRGALTAIGMATTGTHTMFNNCLNGGIFEGIYVHGMRTMGEALLNGKMTLNGAYLASNENQAKTFAHWCNLMGDPTVTVYITAPKLLNIASSDTLYQGSNVYQVNVTDATSHPVSEAVVVLSNGTQYLRSVTNENGQAFISLPATYTGTWVVTASKDNYAPKQKNIITGTTGRLYCSSVVIDDDNSGSSSGNGNAEANSGETLEIKPALTNYSSQVYTSLVATLTCSDPTVVISGNTAHYGAIALNGTTSPTDAFIVHLPRAMVNNTTPIFSMQLVATGLPNTTSSFPLTVTNTDLSFSAYQITSGGNQVVDPGETCSFSVSVLNGGTLALEQATAILRSSDNMLSLSDSLVSFPTIPVGTAATTSTDTYTLSASSRLTPGSVVNMKLVVTNSNGYDQELVFPLTIGTITQSAPLGPDAGGYVIFDSWDNSYPECPVYDWVGIAPAEGGSGTSMAFNDPGTSSDEGDQVGATTLVNVTLPFSFKFYGQSYQTLTTCVNGFIAFGTTQNGDFRNWRLPGALGPNAMVAAFWDDLITSSTGNVYKYYDSALHRFIIEWYRLKNGFNHNFEETFQIILLDPAFYPTPSGNGQIKIQYKTFNNVDTGSTGYSGTHGNYSTVGIKDPTGLIGLEYTFDGDYSTAAHPLANLSALLITPRPVQINTPFLSVGEISYTGGDNDNHPDNGETLQVSTDIMNLGGQAATNVTVTMESTDPYLQIITNTANTTTVPVGSGAMLHDAFQIAISDSVEDQRSIPVTYRLSTSDGQNWVNYRTIICDAPSLNIGQYTFQETSGNNNGVLDPGESGNLIIPIINTGHNQSGAGSYTITSNSAFLVINTNQGTINPIFENGTATLSIPIQVSNAATVGSSLVAQLNTVVGSYRIQATVTVQVGLLKDNFESNGFTTLPWTNNSTSPWSISSQAGEAYAGQYAARSGAIDNNSSTELSLTLTFTSAGQVKFYRKVSSEPGYDYFKFIIDSTTKDQWAGEVPWGQVTYAVAAGTHTLKWQYNKDGAEIGGSDCALIDEVLITGASIGNNNFNPPLNLTATMQSASSVVLNWNAPTSNSKEAKDSRSLTGYHVFRNGTQVTTTPITALTYTDTNLAWLPGQTWEWFVKAVYSNPTGTSSASNIATLTLPLMPPPVALLATAGNGTVRLSWDYALTYNNQSVRKNTRSGRELNSFKIYRNNVAIATISSTTQLEYTDNTVTNGTTYQYYVTAVYANPTYESVPSNVASATPQAPVLLPPTQLDASIVTRDDVLLTWVAPSVTTSTGKSSSRKTRSLIAYKIFRNDEEIHQVTADITTYTDQNLPQGNYTYYVKAVYSEGLSVASNTATISMLASEDPYASPTATTLYQNYPNPFNPDTNIRYSLKDDSNVRIQICNLLGQTVRTLVNTRKGKGTYTIHWDGRDDSGRPVASGVYYYRLYTQDQKLVRKMILMK